MEENRHIKDNPALDDVDHALGRPYRPFDTYRDHYATSCPKLRAVFRASPWWREGVTSESMTFFHVTDEGRHALAVELKKPEYGRLYSITSRRYEGETLIMAKSRSQAKYLAWLNADLDWPFIDYANAVSARLATPHPERNE